jgi:ribosomal protein S18 acetylase RimI-like enzyme
MSSGRERAPEVVEVRVAAVAEAGLLTRLGRKLFEQTFAADNSATDMHQYVSAAFTPARQLHELADPDRVAWLAVVDGREPVGFAMVRRGSVCAGVAASTPVEVERIYVDSTFHGAGVGRRLMEACVAQAGAWKADVLWLGVWEQNPRAISFYEKGGFRTVGSHTFLLGTDEQRDIVMARRLD